MSRATIIELTVPGRLQFCDVARRVVMESCKLLGSMDAGQEPDSAQGTGDGSLSDRYEFEDRFTLEFVSAFSEIYNNIALHAYGDKESGDIGVSIHIGRDHLIVDMSDTGKAFDIDTVPLPGELPTGGMGIFIARSMLDELEYRPGPPNRWRLEKHFGSMRTEAPIEEAAVPDTELGSH